MNVQDVYHMHNCYYWYDTCCMLCMNVHSTMHIHINIYMHIYLYNIIIKYSWVQYETCFGVPDFQNQMHQQLK